MKVELHQTEAVVAPTAQLAERRRRARGRKVGDEMHFVQVEGRVQGLIDTGDRPVAVSTVRAAHLREL